MCPHTSGTGITRLTLVGTAAPPRDRKDDADDDEEEEEEEHDGQLDDDREPAVIREPDPDE